jgi:prefoldin subunit 5
MAVVVNRMRCFTCGKENAITKCEGCSKTFCFNDFGNHRQELNKNLDEIETNRDLIRQQLNERTKEPKTHPLLQQIDQWESESINKIKQAAEENRKSVFSFITKHNNRLENKLNELTDQLKQSRQENDFIEVNLDQWKKQLTQIQEELIKPSNIEINYDSTPFITKIHTYITSKLR